MPELPEVESARRLLERTLVGRRLVRVTAADDPIVFEGVNPRRVVAFLRGRKVLAAGRKGKHFWLELDQRPWPTFHFGMAGWLESREGDGPRPRHWKLELGAEGGARLVLCDTRRFGRIRLRHAPAGEPPISELGFDVLEGLPAAAALRNALRRRQAPIKSVLLDQTLFAGVGNWIADEVLFQAGIRPLRRAAALSLAEVRRLRARLHAIVHRAVAVDADSDRFPRGWLFHRRWGRQADARTTRGERIVHVTIGGRTAAWVPERQR